jgi:hypothetical protein
MQLAHVRGGQNHEFRCFFWLKSGRSFGAAPAGRTRHFSVTYTLFGCFSLDGAAAVCLVGDMPPKAEAPKAGKARRATPKVPSAKKKAAAAHLERIRALDAKYAAVADAPARKAPEKNKKNCLKSPFQMVPSGPRPKLHFRDAHVTDTLLGGPRTSKDRTLTNPDVGTRFIAAPPSRQSMSCSRDDGEAHCGRSP